jgi:hypothetical protein
VDKIEITDFFGFYKFQYTEVEQHKILVYPKLRELKSHVLRNVVNESNESVISNDMQSQSVFTDIRPYIPGDSLNRIHWNLTAKTGEFMTKDYSGQMTNMTMVFLDSYSLGLDVESSIVYEDYMVEGCVSLMHFLLENRIHTKLFYDHFGTKKIEGQSSSDFPKFYDSLAELSFYKEENFIQMIDKVLQVEQDSCHIIIMTQIINLRLAEKLIRLKYRDFEISIIVCDVQSLDVKGVEYIRDDKSRFMLMTSKIPIYTMQHDESSTRLGVS